MRACPDEYLGATPSRSDPPRNRHDRSKEPSCFLLPHSWRNPYLLCRYFVTQSDRQKHRYATLGIKPREGMAAAAWTTPLTT